MLWRVARGGSFAAQSWGCRAAFRNKEEPTFGKYDLGFRIVLSAQEITN
jgi:formylglycine-generating enzyme required for sulfatase activity